MKNSHLGQTCLIIGNGPSLRDVPFGFLYQYPTFGQNKIYLRFIPDFYVCVCEDANAIVKGEPIIDWEQVNNLPSKTFIRENISKYRPDYELHITNDHKFCVDPIKEVYEGYSVTFVSLQLAFWMGFATVLLVGVDFKYKPYDEQSEIDPNHFIKAYNGLTNFSPQSLEKGKKGIIESMTLARDAYQKADRVIVNLTEGTALDVFEKQSINDWYKKESL